MEIRILTILSLEPTFFTKLTSVKEQGKSNLKTNCGQNQILNILINFTRSEVMIYKQSSVLVNYFFFSSSLQVLTPKSV